jgi:ATP-dependent Clp protease ATP-binding subunit ClpA
VRAFLLQRAAGNIEQGRRGIGNLIETTLLNPLARLIFDRKLSGPRLVVKEIGEKSEWEVVSYFLNIESAE